MTSLGQELILLPTAMIAASGAFFSDRMLAYASMP